jgi:hypothetical protein
MRSAKNILVGRLQREGHVYYAGADKPATLIL